MILHRKLRILFGLTSALLLCVPLVFWLSKSQKSSDLTPASFSKSKYPAPRQTIKGFRFSSVQDGVNILSIDASRFSIEKKKIGFLRFGLAGEAILQDAHFKIYGYTPSVDTQSSDPSGKGPPLSGDNNVGNSPPAKDQFVLRNIFSKQAIPAALTSKNLAFISARPISIEICTKDKVITRFSAENGSFNLRQRAIQLSGNVRVQSGDRVLRTSELAINPSLALIKARGDFHFSFPDGQTRGRGLTTDIMLNPKNMMNR